MRVLVTGGAGYIGSVVAQQLLDAGHQVSVVDDLSTGHREAVPAAARFLQSDIRDVRPRDLEAVEAVVHFAARSLVAESVIQPSDYWSVNVTGTLALLEAMREAATPRFVFSSTAAVYGLPETSPITEAARTAPINPYGASKLAVDSMIAGWCAAYGLAGVSLRYFNVAGAHGEVGERHHPETHLIPNVLGVAEGRREAVDVNGTDYPTPDGTCVRDYIHVVDLGEAHLSALAACRAGVHEVINLGSGGGYSVLEVVQAARDVTGRSIPTRPVNRRPGDPPVLVASNARARDFLGWRPTRSLHEMVEDAWAFTQR